MMAKTSMMILSIPIMILSFQIGVSYILQKRQFVNGREYSKNTPRERRVFCVTPMKIGVQQVLAGSRREEGDGPMVVIAPSQMAPVAAEMRGLGMPRVVKMPVVPRFGGIARKGDGGSRDQRGGRELG